MEADGVGGGENDDRVAAKIKELNGDKSVSAAFIVGGGGKIHGYTEMLAKKLDLRQSVWRCAERKCCRK